MDWKNGLVSVVAIAVVATSASGVFAEENPIREENRDLLIGYMNANSDRTWDPDQAVTLETSHGIEELPAREAMDRLLDRLEKADLELADAWGRASASGSEDTANATAGDLFVFETNVDPAIGCNQHGRGPGGHWDYAVPTGSHGRTVLGFPVGIHTFQGAATSKISLGDEGRGVVGSASTAVQVAGTTIPATQSYADEIRYEGSSDFWCVETSDGFTVNAPVLRGTFGPTAEGPTQQGGVST